MEKIKGPRRLKVNSPRNSHSDVSLSELDFSEWWTDGWPAKEGQTTGFFYLHVPNRDGDRVHRVYCKHTDSPRLRMMKGELYWLVDRRKA